MRSFTIIVAFTLFERGLVTANYYNFFVRSLDSRPVELNTLASEPSISVAALRNTYYSPDAVPAEFWIDNSDKTIVASRLGSPRHASFNHEEIITSVAGRWGNLRYTGFNSDEIIARRFRPIYFAKETENAKEILTKVRGHTLTRAKGFDVDQDVNLTFKNDARTFAFCPYPFGDVVIVKGAPYKNNDDQPLVLGVIEAGGSTLGCVQTLIKTQKIKEET